MLLRERGEKTRRAEDRKQLNDSMFKIELLDDPGDTTIAYERLAEPRSPGSS